MTPGAAARSASAADVRNRPIVRLLKEDNEDEDGRDCP
jgi:hypothetical protein